jgi:assimilatory nitrate reductase catalytic subunit
VLLGRTGTLFPYTSAESIWNEHRESTRGRDLDITGLSYALLASRGPQQWPFPSGAASGKKRLYEDNIFPTPSGRAHFVDTVYKPVAEPVDAHYPFRLTTGRLRDQWHGMSRTGTVGQLFSHAAEAAVVMAPGDMERRLLAAGDLVHVTSRRGSQILPVAAGDDMRAGQAFIAMHWGEEYLSGRGPHASASFGVNALTSAALDPSSKQPELKHAAVKILKAELPWHLLVFGWVDADHAVALQARLRPYLREFAFATCTLFGRDRVGVMLRAADDYPAAPELVAAIAAHFGLDSGNVLRYDDARRGNSRRMRIDDGRLCAVALAGDTGAGGWLKAYLDSAEPVAPLGRRLLMATATPPSGFVSRGRIICNCIDVAESEITATLATLDGPPEARMGALQARLKCGTSCGSCLPELKLLVAREARQAPVT